MERDSGLCPAHGSGLYRNTRSHRLASDRSQGKAITARKFPELGDPVAWGHSPSLAQQSPATSLRSPSRDLPEPPNAEAHAPSAAPHLCPCAKQWLSGAGTDAAQCFSKSGAQASGIRPGS